MACPSVTDILAALRIGYELECEEPLQIHILLLNGYIRLKCTNINIRPNFLFFNHHVEVI